jgi:metallophosphoesterase superfamily enzyme
MEEGGFVCFVKAWGRGSVLIFPASDPVVGGDNAEVVLGFVFSGLCVLALLFFFIY